tara:strand:+ start:229 stop:597 length:369 start_codon:yes stop_codon:yes gene_type:complete
MIEAAEYKLISDDIGNARSDSEKAFKLVQTMQRHLRDSEVDVNDIDKLTLRNDIELTYFIVVSRYFQPHRELIGFVSALQTHVARFSGSVDDYLSSNDLKVSQDFADVSSIVGFEISIENIE